MGFEAAKTVQYFAYGANMSSLKLRERLTRNKLESQPAQILSSHFYLSFIHRGGFASLVDIKKNQALTSLESNVLAFQSPHGVLYTLTSEELQLIARSETGYSLCEDLEVITFDQQILKACAFISNPSLRLSQPVMPTKRYMKYLLSGAKENKLNLDYIAWLQSIQGVDSNALGPEYFDTPSVLYTNIAFFTIIVLLLAVLAVSG